MLLPARGLGPTLKERHLGLITQLKREMNLDIMHVVTSVGRLAKQSRDETGITANV